MNSFQCSQQLEKNTSLFFLKKALQQVLNRVIFQAGTKKCLRSNLLTTPFNIFSSTWKQVSSVLEVFTQSLCQTRKNKINISLFRFVSLIQSKTFLLLLMVSSYGRIFINQNYALSRGQLSRLEPGRVWVRFLQHLTCFLVNQPY